MEKQGKVSVASYSNCIKFMGKSLNLTKALEIYRGIPDESTKSNVIVCNSGLSCLVRSGKFDSSIKLFHEMKHSGLTPDAITYTAFLAGCIKVKDSYDTALDLVQELNFRGLKMDSAETTRKLRGWFKICNLQGLNQFRQVILTTLLKVYMRGGLFKKSRELLSQLESLGYAKDEGLFETAISRYIAEPEKKDLLIHLLKWMPGQGYAVNSSTRNVILKNSHLFGRHLIGEILSKQRQLSKSVKS
ncbi:unnamed protein product [Linum tenue]|uniref:Pentatricopeptide repeat-containing protein n=1 Tax=Linum tenue TaxID=586396 RepID=A0AAV0GTV3_9ROSI|nr:unnamed protein product [Linum tenue]